MIWRRPSGKPVVKRLSFYSRVLDRRAVAVLFALWVILDFVTRGWGFGMTYVMACFDSPVQRPFEEFAGYTSSLAMVKNEHTFWNFSSKSGTW